MNTPIIKPFGDRVLLQLIPDDKVTTGGIHLPDNLAKPKPGFTRRAVVLAVGKKVKRVYPLQTVHATWNCGVPVPMALLPDGEAMEQRIIKEEDILALER